MDSFKRKQPCLTFTVSIVLLITVNRNFIYFSIFFLHNWSLYFNLYEIQLIIKTSSNLPINLFIPHLPLLPYTQSQSPFSWFLNPITSIQLFTLLSKPRISSKCCQNKIDKIWLENNQIPYQQKILILRQFAHHFESNFFRLFSPPEKKLWQRLSSEDKRHLILCIGSGNICVIYWQCREMCQSWYEAQIFTAIPRIILTSSRSAQRNNQLKWTQKIAQMFFFRAARVKTFKNL
jgi:hypothetical protein